MELLHKYDHVFLFFQYEKIYVYFNIFIIVHIPRQDAWCRPGGRVVAKLQSLLSKQMREYFKVKMFIGRYHDLGMTGSVGRQVVMTRTGHHPIHHCGGAGYAHPRRREQSLGRHGPAQFQNKVG